MEWFRLVVNFLMIYKVKLKYDYKHVPMVKPSGSFGLYSLPIAAEIEFGACSEVNTIY
jgi:hypothetical protein